MGDGSLRKKLEQFCDKHAGLVSSAVMQLPLRMRFVVCASESGMTYEQIARQLPKVDEFGQFTGVVGVSTARVGAMMLAARKKLQDSEKKTEVST